MSTPTDSPGTPAPNLGQALTIHGASMQVRTAPGPNGAPIVLVIVGNPVAAAALPLDDESVGILIASLTSCRQEARVAAAAAGLAADRPGQIVVPGGGAPRKLDRL